MLDESFAREVDGSPALMVHEDCEPVLAFCRHWTGRKDGTEHVGDGLRYLLVPILASAWEWGRVGAAAAPMLVPIESAAHSPGSPAARDAALAALSRRPAARGAGGWDAGGWDGSS